MNDKPFDSTQGKRLMISGKYEPVIGLEVHVELATKSKMFCQCSADYFGKEPNTHTCPVCLGLPGALPVANKKAIEWCIAIGLALNCEIPLSSKFDRKNYFYPDLPRGYQISQYDMPFCVNGQLTLKNGKKIKIQRVHMEEDTGKLTHAVVNGKKVSLIDFNRSGVPLVEIVTEPDFETVEEMVEYLKKLQQIVRYLGVSQADMEKGDMRVEPNVSLRKTNEKNLPPYKVELKNINSFKFAQKAVEYEVKRQSEILDSGKTPIQETRGWNEVHSKTVSQRSKEEAHDYRYFPEPDIPPISLDAAQIKKITSLIPELPDVKLKRFQKEYDISSYDAEILTREKKIADFFEEAVKAAKKASVSVKQIANVIINQKPNLNSIIPAQLVKNIKAAGQTETLSGKELEEAAKEVLKENEKMANDYRAGNVNAIQALIGALMRKTQRKADTQKAKKLLEDLLS